MRRTNKGLALIREGALKCLERSSASARVYQKDPNGGWSKYDNGNWEPVDKSGDRGRKTGGDDSPLKSRGDRAATTPTTRTGEQKMSAEGSAFRDRENRTQLGAERVPQGQMRPTAIAPDTFQQLNHDAFAREQGGARERAFNRGAPSGRSFGGGAKGGRHR